MKINLLSTGVGLIADSQPEKIAKTDFLTLKFANSPQNATVNVTTIVNGEAISFVRKLDGKSMGKCSLPTNNLGNTILITVTDYGTINRHWICERIAVVDCGECNVLMPEVFDWREKVNTLALENEALRMQMAELNERIAELTKKVETAFEGYDVI